MEHELPERVACAEQRRSARGRQLVVPHDERTEAGDRVVLGVDDLAQHDDAALQRLLEHRVDQRVLALEEKVERVQRQPRPLDDLLDRELETAAFRDQVECRVDQRRGALLRTRARLADRALDREVAESLGLGDELGGEVGRTDGGHGHATGSRTCSAKSKRRRALSKTTACASTSGTPSNSASRTLFEFGYVISG